MNTHEHLAAYLNRSTGSTEPIPVRVAVPRRHDHVVVDFAIAVVVDPVAELVHVLVDEGVVVVAVDVVGHDACCPWAHLEAPLAVHDIPR